MSFSSEVKEELSKRIASSRHCQLAEISAIVTCIGHVEADKAGNTVLYLQADNAQVLRKFFTLLRKAFNIVTSILEDVPDVRIGGRIYSPVLTDTRQVEDVLMATKLMDKDGNIRDFAEGASPLVVKNSCCKRAFLRDAFLCTGSISDPNKGYHLEFDCCNVFFFSDQNDLAAPFLNIGGRK